MHHLVRFPAVALLAVAVLALGASAASREDVGGVHLADFVSKYDIGRAQPSLITAQQLQQYERQRDVQKRVLVVWGRDDTTNQLSPACRCGNQLGCTRAVSQ
jgi:hypothetical protein